MKKIVFALTMILLLFIFTGADVPEKGSTWVYDEPQVVSEETEDFIRTLNEDIFPTYKNTPQLGIMIVNELPEGYTIDEYKLEQFNLYGVGTWEENCGMLFVFAINDRKYGFEIGDGFKKGTLLRKELETDFITSDMKVLLREENYDAVVLQVAKYLGQLMEDEENGVYMQKEQASLLQQQQKEQLKNEAVQSMRKYYRLGFAGVIGIALVIYAVPAVTAVVNLIVDFITNLKRKKILKELIETNYRHVRIVETVGGSSEDSLLDALMYTGDNVDISDLEQKFIGLLYELYIECACMELEKMDHKHDLSYYKEHLLKVNNYEAFEMAHVQALNSIVHEVDRTLLAAQEVEKQNHKKIHIYVIAKEPVLTEKNIPLEDVEEAMKKYCKFNVVMTDEELNEAFQKEFKEFVFRYEYEQFIKENRDSIDYEYFDSQKFYNSLRNGKEYENYNIYQDRQWMLPFLLMHMEHKRHEIRMREERERQQAARRREEQARREKEQRDSTSSFGSSFGGGYSSGGGFSGGW